MSAELVLWAAVAFVYAAIVRRLWVVIVATVKLIRRCRARRAPEGRAVSGRSIERLERPEDWKSEADFRRQLVALLRARGWRVHFQPPRPSRKGYITFGDPGWPDIVALRPPDFVAVELKWYGGQIRDEQRVWLNGLTAAGVAAFVADPGAWPKLVKIARDGLAALTVGADEQEEQQDEQTAG